MIVKDFWDNKTITNNNCWEWQGCRGSFKRSPKGYGFVYDSFSKSTKLVHRLAWSLANNNEIPKGLLVRHKCDNSICYNPKHLELGTSQDNSRDSWTRNRKPKEICANGHEYSNAFIVHYSNGKTQRRCRLCRRAEIQRYKQRKKLAIPLIS